MGFAVVAYHLREFVGNLDEAMQLQSLGFIKNHSQMVAEFLKVLKRVTARPQERFKGEF